MILRRYIFLRKSQRWLMRVGLFCIWGNNFRKVSFLRTANVFLALLLNTDKQRSEKKN
jgi:hypothetical protein